MSASTLYGPDGRRLGPPRGMPQFKEAHLRARFFNFIYRCICRGEGNDAIRAKAEKSGFPKLDDQTVQGLRERILATEKERPELMAKIREQILK